MSKSLEYQKFRESLESNTLGYFIAKYNIPRERIYDLILQGGRRADSKIVKRNLSSMSPRSNWSVIGWGLAPNSKLHQIALYNYNAKAWQVFYNGKRVNNINYAWPEILKLIGHTIDKNNPVVELLDNNWKQKLSDKISKDLALKVSSEPEDDSLRFKDLDYMNQSSRPQNANAGRIPVPYGRTSESSRVLNPRKKYRDDYDGTVKTGAQWNKFFIKEAEEYIEELKWDFERIGKTPAKGEIPTLEDQIQWTRDMYLQGGEWDHYLREV